MKTRMLYNNVDLRQGISDSPLKGIWNLMQGFRHLYLGAVLFMAVAAVTKTISFIMLRFFVDEVLTTRQYLYNITLLALGYVGLAVIEGTASFFRGKLSARTAEGVTLRLRDYLFNHIQHLSFTYHDKTQTGELIERVTSDVDKICAFYANQAPQIGSIITLIVFNFIAIRQLYPGLSLLAVSFLPFVLIVSILFFKRIFTAFDNYQEQEACLSAVLQENISGIRVVRAFARSPYEIDKFEQENLEKLKRGRTLVSWHAYFWPVSHVLCMGQMLLMIVLGGSLAIRGEISIGTYIAIMGLVGHIIWPMRNIGQFIINASMTFVSYNRVAQLLAEEPEPEKNDELIPKIKGEVKFENVCFRYNNGEQVLEDISFSCRSGEVIALLGETGSGKTSLVNLLPGFYKSTAGRIYLDGRALDEYSLHALRSQIGIIEQEPFLFSCTLEENIRAGSRRDVSEAQIHEVARAAHIHDVIMEFPQKYQTRVGEKGVTLSGGQKQRLAIARTLLKDPRILILDDATSSLDSRTEEHIQLALSRLMHNRTCFIIAHRIQTVMRADKILILKQGRIVQHGTHASLSHEEGFYRQIFQSQFEGGNYGG